MPCQCCAVDGPTQLVHFEQNIGLIVTRLTSKLEMELCRSCIGRAYRSYTLTTLFLGWWGMISLLMTPVILVTNTLNWWRARDLAEPSLSVSNVPIGAPPPPIGAGNFTFKLVVGIIAWSVVACAIAYRHVTFLEKHAPIVNAKLHQGEIADEQDGEYTGIQVGKDIAGLESDLKSSDWQGLRSELLARKPLLDDLVAQNAKLQSRLGVERSANLDANDICENLSLEEFGPALDGYTKSWRTLFEFAKQNPTLDSEASSQGLNAISKTEENHLKELQAYWADFKAKGCDK